MAKNKKMTPLRFLRRNTLNILLVVLMLALLVGIALVAKQMLNLMQAPQPPVQSEENQPPQSETPPDQPVDPVVPDAPVEDPTDEPEEDMPVMFIPPFDGETVFLANDKLALTYDATALSLSEQNGLYTLLDITGPLLPRVELQALKGSLEELTIEDRRNVAIGLLQAYYYMPPEADLVTCSDEHDAMQTYSVTLSCEAYREVAAMTAKVQLMQIGEELWYVIELLPEGQEHAALTQAFDNLVIR